MTRPFAAVPQPEPQLAKPPYGSPCNGCGVCCQNEICPLGQLAFPSLQAPCPALERDSDQFNCGLVAHPERYAPIRTSVNGAESMRAAAAFGIGLGFGCDTRMPGESDPPEEFIQALRRLEHAPRSLRRNAEKLWSDAR